MRQACVHHCPLVTELNLQLYPHPWGRGGGRGADSSNPLITTWSFWWPTFILMLSGTSPPPPPHTHLSHLISIQKMPISRVLEVPVPGTEGKDKMIILLYNTTSSSFSVFMVYVEPYLLSLPKVEHKIQSQDSQCTKSPLQLQRLDDQGGI